MRAPQLIIVCLWALSLGIELVKHGQPRTGNHNAVAQILATAICALILYWGGFFG
jgi:hypothetical protein